MISENRLISENRSVETLPAVAGLAGDALDVDEERWAAVSPRMITPQQWKRFEGYMEEIFTALGMPAATPATVDTTRRFLRALFDATSGYEGDENLVTAFPTECRGGPDCRISQVVEGPIPFYSLCEHHSLPLFGRAYVGYIAHEHILGLSKLTRLVRLFARRFSVQERIGQQLTDALESILAPHGVAGHLEAVHLCMQMRGVRERQSSTRTTYWRGNYDIDAQLRSEFFTLCDGPGRPGMAQRDDAFPAHRARILSEPLTLLYKEPGLPHWNLPTRLAVAYGGDLGFSELCLYANFVASLDGVVALGPEYPS